MQSIHGAQLLGLHHRRHRACPIRYSCTHQIPFRAKYPNCRMAVGSMIALSFVQPSPGATVSVIVCVRRQNPKEVSISLPDALPETPQLSQRFRFEIDSIACLCCVPCKSYSAQADHNDGISWLTNRAGDRPTHQPGDYQLCGCQVSRHDKSGVLNVITVMYTSRWCIKDQNI